jgi:hypothetical protein
MKEAFQSGTVVGAVVFFSGFSAILCLPLSAGISGSPQQTVDNSHL